MKHYEILTPMDNLINGLYWKWSYAQRERVGEVRRLKELFVKAREEGKKYGDSDYSEMTDRDYVKLWRLNGASDIEYYEKKFMEKQDEVNRIDKVIYGVEEIIKTMYVEAIHYEDEQFKLFFETLYNPIKNKVDSWETAQRELREAQEKAEKKRIRALRKYRKALGRGMCEDDYKAIALMTKQEIKNYLDEQLIEWTGTRLWGDEALALDNLDKVWINVYDQKQWWTWTIFFDKDLMTIKFYDKERQWSKRCEQKLEEMKAQVEPVAELVSN